VRGGLGEPAVRLGVGVVQCLLGLEVGLADGLLRLVLGVADDLVAAVEHVLGVVELAGQRVADLVEQLQHVAPGHHAARGHGETSGLLHDRDQLVKRLEHPVHGGSSRHITPRDSLPAEPPRQREARPRVSAWTA
jgi:hypothetical protein